MLGEYGEKSNNVAHATFRPERVRFLSICPMAEAWGWSE